MLSFEHFPTNRRLPQRVVLPTKVFSPSKRLSVHVMRLSELPPRSEVFPRFHEPSPERDKSLFRRRQWCEKMKITVILCTYYPGHSRPKALESVASQVLPESVAWEVLVVDNNSNDQTRAVTEDY